MTFQEAKDFILENRFAEPENICFRAAVVIWWSLHNHTWDVIKIHKATGYEKSEIRLFIDNLKSNDRLCNGVLYLDYTPDDYVHNMVELTLLFMLAANEIICIKEYMPDVQLIRETPFKHPGIFIEDYQSLAAFLQAVYYLHEKRKTLYPIPKTYLRMKRDATSYAVRPLYREGRKVTCMTLSVFCEKWPIGSLVDFHITELYQICYMSGNKTQDVIDKVIAETAFPELISKAV